MASPWLSDCCLKLGDYSFFCVLSLTAANLLFGAGQTTQANAVNTVARKNGAMSVRLRHRYKTKAANTAVRTTMIRMLFAFTVSPAFPLLVYSYIPPPAAREYYLVDIPAHWYIRIIVPKYQNVKLGP